MFNRPEISTGLSALKARVFGAFRGRPARTTAAADAGVSGNPADGKTFETVDIFVKAAIVSITPTATDYAETLTFRAMSTC